PIDMSHHIYYSQAEEGKAVREATETEKAWMSGFLDGEGCISIRRDIRSTGPVFYPFVSVVNCVLAPLNVFEEVYGGRICSRIKEKQEWKQSYVWIATIKDGSLSKILEDITPYLIVKNLQAELVLR